MTTSTGILGRIARRLLAAALALELAAASAEPALAQRRREEPEANPQFQQQLQSAPAQESGQPITNVAEPTAAPAGAEEPEGARNMQSVQIGTNPAPKAVARESVTPLETRVTVRVKGAPLATFLDTISAQAKINFIITEGLESRRVTAFLQNVTVREALQVLLEIKGLTYQQIGKSNTYLVTPRSRNVENVITRIYALRYIPLIPLSTVAGQGGGSNQGAPTNLGGMMLGGLGVTSGQGSGGQQSGGVMGNDIAIINVIRSILTKTGQVVIEPRTNSLIVTDVPEVFPQVEQIILELDRKAAQVMIEAQIVEIDSDKEKDLGFEWGGANGELGGFRGGQRDTSFPLQLNGDASKIRFLDPVTGVASSIGGSSGSGASGIGSSGSGPLVFGSFIKTSILDLTQLSIVLRALVSRSEARFLGKPKILSLNNKQATIDISRNQALSIQTTITSAGSSAVSAGGTTAERQQTGLVLRVTPQVNSDGYITMLVNPSFTDVVQSPLSAQAQPVFDTVTREASTLVRVKNGQTLVLGGLLSSKETKVVRKVPLLGYIPLIGWLFTSVQSRRSNTDLVIFLTPTIVND